MAWKQGRTGAGDESVRLLAWMESSKRGQATMGEAMENTPLEVHGVARLDGQAAKNAWAGRPVVRTGTMI